MNQPLLQTENNFYTKHCDCDAYQCQFWCCCFPIALFEYLGFTYGCCPAKEHCCICNNV